MFDLLFDIGADALLDTLKLLPFLFLTYLLMELIEHRAGERQEALILKAGRFGAIPGALLGLFPQCGFSASAAGLYAAGLLSRGTLLAIFLSTSDEMLPLLISHRAPASTILPLLGIKLAVGIATGLAVDLIAPKRPTDAVDQIGAHCREKHCHCNEGLLRSSLVHTAQIALFLLAANLLLTALMELVGLELLRTVLSDIPLLGECVAALVGLIPNCAASVALTELYLGGVIPAGTLLAGLLPGAGVGLLVLLRANRRGRDNLLTVGILVAVGIGVGLAVNLLSPLL